MQEPTILSLNEISDLIKEPVHNTPESQALRTNGQSDGIKKLMATDKMTDEQRNQLKKLSSSLFQRNAE